jgi:hypothetical protein
MKRFGCWEEFLLCPSQRHVPLFFFLLISPSSNLIWYSSVFSYLLLQMMTQVAPLNPGALPCSSSPIEKQISSTSTKWDISGCDQNEVWNFASKLILICFSHLLLLFCFYSIGLFHTCCDSSCCSLFMLNGRFILISQLRQPIFIISKFTLLH